MNFQDEALHAASHFHSGMTPKALDSRFRGNDEHKQKHWILAFAGMTSTRNESLRNQTRQRRRTQWQGLADTRYRAQRAARSWRQCHLSLHHVLRARGAEARSVAARRR